MVISFANDWRGGSFNMGDLIRNLYDTPEGRNMSDVTFVLDDGTKLHAQKLILITASPHFEDIFHRPMDYNQEPVQEIKIEDVHCTGRCFSNYVKDNLQFWKGGQRTGCC